MRKALNDRCSRFNIKNELMIIAAALSFGFTLMLFSPTEFYADNPAAFMVEYRIFAVPMLGFAVLTSAAVVVLLNILLYIKEELCSVFTRILLGLLLAFFTQSVFMDKSMPIVIPNDTRYDEYKTKIIINSVIFWTIAAAPLVTSAVLKILKKKNSRETATWIAFGAFTAIFVFNLASSGINLFNSNFRNYEGVHRQYLSYEPAMSLSTDENIVVFLTDRLDREWMDDILAEYPDLKNELDGFTYYRNNVSIGTSTFPVVPSVLTGGSYDGEEWAEFLSEAWSGKTLPRQLRENGYKVYLMPDSITTLSSTSQIQDQCDNIKEYGENELKLRIFGKRALFPVMVRLSLARMSPYALKHRLYYWLGANFCRNFYEDTTRSDALGPQCSVVGDMKFYNNLKSIGLKSDAASKTFTFVHLNCAHTVDSGISSVYGLTETPDVHSTIRGDLEIVSEYIRQMKSLGVFDNSTIIILGDHGRAPAELKGNQTTLDSAITSALLIKPANGDAHPLKTDSESELSIDLFTSSILEYANIDNSDFGYSYNDVIENNISRERVLRSYDFAGYGRMVYQAMYHITGNAREFENWIQSEE